MMIGRIVCVTFIFTTVSNGLYFNKSAEIPSLNQHANHGHGCAGCKSAVNLNDKDVLKRYTEYATRGLEKLEQTDGDANNTYEIIHVKEATSQVVAGAAYDIIFYIGECNTNTTVST